MRNMYGKELKFPEDLYYTEELLWVKDLGGNKIRIGVSDLGVKSVKHLVHVKMSANAGDKVTKGDSMGHIETTKGVWVISAPLAGTIIEINKPLTMGNANPIDSDNYGNGWIMDIEVADADEVKALMNGADEATQKWLVEKAEEIVPLWEEDDDDDDD